MRNCWVWQVFAAFSLKSRGFECLLRLKFLKTKSQAYDQSDRPRTFYRNLAG